MVTEPKVIKALIVDDDARITVFLEDYLQLTGHVTEVVHDAKKALTLLKEKNYDVVFLDFEMPEITGLELTRMIRKTDKETKIVMMTGYELMEDFIASSVGADEFLSKPFNIGNLEALIQKFQKAIGR